MRVLLIEEEPGSAERIVMAIERARPGVLVTVATTVEGALTTGNLDKFEVRVAILGPELSHRAEAEDVLALRDALGEDPPIIALSPWREDLDLDAAYQPPSDWEGLSKTVATLLDEWTS